MSVTAPEKMGHAQHRAHQMLPLPLSACFSPRRAPKLESCSSAVRGRQGMGPLCMGPSAGLGAPSVEASP